MRIAACLCLLLVLAGCNAPVDTDETPARTVTPAPIPADDGLAPGVTRDGIESPVRLADGHASALANQSYTLTATRTVRYPNGTVRSGLRVRIALAEDRSYLAHASTAGPAGPAFLGDPPANATFWSNGSVYARRLARGDTVRYNTFEPVAGAGTWQYWTRTVPFGGGDGSPRTFLTRTFESVPTRVEERMIRQNETTYRVVGERATGPLGGVATPRDVRLTAHVTASGLVTSLSLQYTGRIDGVSVTVERTIRYERVGETSVGRPPWLDRAVD